jgi:hypothetical protein
VTQPDSQADSEVSIPFTRSNTSAQLRESLPKLDPSSSDLAGHCGAGLPLGRPIIPSHPGQACLVVVQRKEACFDLSNLGEFPLGDSKHEFLSRIDVNVGDRHPVEGQEGHRGRPCQPLIAVE